jgi:predicted GTPase
VLKDARKAPLLSGSLAIEDGPTVTHGEMKECVGPIAARKFDVKELVDSIKRTYERFPPLRRVLPAMGYGEKQVRDQEQTIAAIDCNSLVLGTPIDLRRIIKVAQKSR